MYLAQRVNISIVAHMRVNKNVPVRVEAHCGNCLAAFLLGRLYVDPSFRGASRMVLTKIRGEIKSGSLFADNDTRSIGPYGGGEK